MTPDQLEHAKRFVQTLHPHPAANRLVQFVLLRGKETQMHWLWDTRQFEAVLTDVLTANTQGWHCFIGVNPRASMSGGEQENIARTTALCVDVDEKKVNGLFSKVTAELARLKFPQPSIVVGSGNGKHAYWLLDAEANPTAAEDIAERLCAMCASDWVHNSNRIMRLPGTVNWKNPPTWCLAETVTPAVFSLAAIDQRMTEVGLPPFEPEPILPDAPLNPPADLHEAVCRLPELARAIILKGDISGLPSNSEADWAVCVALIGAGCTDAQVRRVFQTYPCGALKVRGAPAGYLERTLARAREHANQERAAKLRALALPQPPFVEIAPGRHKIVLTAAYSARAFWD